MKNITLIFSIGLMLFSCEQRETPSPEQTKPTVTTNEVTNITTTTATCSGNVTSDGGSSVTARGVCWSTSQNPTTKNSKTTDGTGKGAFTGNLTGLTANTIYYVRAYATNSQGTAYGEQKTFTTSQKATVNYQTYGIYSLGDTLTIYRQFAEQWSIMKYDTDYDFRIQNLKDKKVVTISDIPLNPESGSTFSIVVNVFGYDKISTGNKSVTVIRNEGHLLHLYDNRSKTSYVVYN